MPQAATNLSLSPSPIELLWKLYETAAGEKARIYAIFDGARALTGGNDAAADVAFDRAEAAANAAYDALEDIVDKILVAKMTSSVTDVAIKARVLGTRGVDGIGYYRPEDILQFFADVQTFAARMELDCRLSAMSFATLAEAEQALIDRGFYLIPGTCDWLHSSGSIDAGIYPIEGPYGVVEGFRVEAKPTRNNG